MGRSITPAYRLEMNGSTPSSWSVRECGKPTEANLQKWILAYAKSLEAGGANAHISAALGHIPYPSSARIVRQLPRSRAGEVMATWKAGIFQVW